MLEFRRQTLTLGDESDFANQALQLRRGAIYVRSPRTSERQCGTLIAVLTNVTTAPKDSTLPFSVTTDTLPAVENEAPAWEIMVPSMVPPPPAFARREYSASICTFYLYISAIDHLLRGRSNMGDGEIRREA
jgi:hypothetical protein